MTLASTPVGPIIPVSDLDAARAFYEGRLGLAGDPTPGGYALRAGDGTSIYLLPVDGSPGPARWPLASFLVDDIAAKVDELRERGVEFMVMSEASGDPFTTDARGVAAQEGLAVAWMLDPDGQMLTLFELT
jgi:catechol 2,3-dioxygenase-like lactoylglutathione lyase family enzyme